MATELRSFGQLAIHMRNCQFPGCGKAHNPTKGNGGIYVRGKDGRWSFICRDHLKQTKRRAWSCDCAPSCPGKKDSSLCNCKKD